MWPEGQWEASKKIAWGGDRQINRHTDITTTRKNLPKCRFFENIITIKFGQKTTNFNKILWDKHKQQTVWGGPKFHPKNIIYKCQLFKLIVVTIKESAIW